MNSRIYWAILLVGSLSHAQGLEVTSTYRSYSLWTSGYDYEFDEYEYVQRETTDTYEPWTQEEQMVLIDYYGVEVSRARARHDSVLSPQGISASMLSEGSSSLAPYFQTDAGGTNELETQFEVAHRVRYSLQLDVSTSLDGYSVAWTSLTGPGGSHFAQQLWGGDQESHTESGWLQVGSYALDLDLDAGILLTHGQSGVCTTHLDFDLVIFQAADFDLDGDVDRADRNGFRQSFLGGSPEADMDANGLINGEDWRLYLRAWTNAFFQDIRF